MDEPTTVYTCTRHFQQRMLERHGIEVTQEDCDHAMADIRNGRAIYIGEANKAGARFYRLLHRPTGKRIDIVFQPNTRSFITALDTGSFLWDGQRWAKRVRPFGDNARRPGDFEQYYVGPARNFKREVTMRVRFEKAREKRCA